MKVDVDMGVILVVLVAKVLELVVSLADVFVNIIIKHYHHLVGRLR